MHKISVIALEARSLTKSIFTTTNIIPHVNPETITLDTSYRATLPSLRHARHQHNTGIDRDKFETLLLRQMTGLGSALVTSGVQPSSGIGSVVCMYYTAKSWHHGGAKRNVKVVRTIRGVMVIMASGWYKCKCMMVRTGGVVTVVRGRPSIERVRSFTERTVWDWLKTVPDRAAVHCCLGLTTPCWTVSGCPRKLERTSSYRVRPQ